ncbi:MAG: agmatinase [Elusimicrobiota bacterium]
MDERRSGGYLRTLTMAAKSAKSAHTLAPLKFLGPKDNFLALPKENSDPRTARFVIVPVPYERTTSYRKGTKNGPEKLIEASHQLEFYDEELGAMTAHDNGIATLAPIVPSAKETAPVYLTRVADTVSRILDMGKRVITIGGEHTVAYGPVLAYSKKYPDLSILHIDAHADLRSSYEGTPWNHACALRRCIECFPTPPRTAMLGIRNVDSEEATYLKANRNIKYFHMEEHRQDVMAVLPELLEHLGDKVYITIDLDGLDPAIIPGVGTPQPGGLGWYETLDIIKAVFADKDVVGFDFMELAPIKGEVVSEFTAAKFLYKLIGYACLADRRRRASSQSAILSGS